MSPEWSGEKRIIKIATGDKDTLGNSAPGYTKRFFQDIGSLPGNIGAKQQMSDLMTEFEVPLKSTDEVSKDPDVFKREMYALTAFGTEEVWAIASVWINKENNALEEVVKVDQKFTVRPLSEEESAYRFSQVESITEAFYLLKEYT